jgi:Domain of unknown function (DUF305)
MTKHLIYILICLLVPAAFAQEVTVTTATVSTTASAFQVIDDARATNEDADLMYIQATVARNEAAIEAAKTILKTSFDADVRMLAGDSLKSHDTELRTLKAWLNLHGPKVVVTTATAPSVPVMPKATVAIATKPAMAVPVIMPVSASVTVTSTKPLPASTEVTITTPRAVSQTEPLPGASLSMNPVAEPTMQLLDVPPVPVSLTPLTH